MGCEVHHTYSSKVYDSKITRTGSGHRNVKGHVLGAMMLFEGDCVNLSHIMTVNITLLNEAQTLSVRDKNGGLKCT